MVIITALCLIIYACTHYSDIRISCWSLPLETVQQCPRTRNGVCMAVHTRGARGVWGLGLRMGGSIWLQNQSHLEETKSEETHFIYSGYFLLGKKSTGF